MSLKKIKIEYSPLTDRVNLYRMGKDPLNALESLDVTGQVFGAVIHTIMNGRPNGGSTVVEDKTSGQSFEVRVVPVVKEKTE